MNASTAAGETKKLTLKPKKKSANKRVSKFLAAGKKAKATIKVKFTDAVGNSVTKKVRVTLFAKKKN